MKNELVVFEGHQIRRIYDGQTETWWFSVVDIIRVLTQQADHRKAQSYWTTLKNRLKAEGSEVVTKCDQLKMPATDGKNYLTDAATAETLLRLVQSVPSPKAEPIKLWLAKVGYERMQEMADPGRSLARARETWQKQGRSAKWIEQRIAPLQRHPSRRARRTAAAQAGERMKIKFDGNQDFQLDATRSVVDVFNPHISHFRVRSADFQSAFSVLATPKPPASRRSRL
jgi:hypothetical protein